MELLIILYLVSFLRTIIVIAAIYFAIRLFTRYILPVILEKKLKDIQKEMEKHRRQQSDSRNEGNVTIEYEKRKRADDNTNEGEYIDFEEIE